VTYPSTNGVSHIERKQYYWYTSLLAAQCGQNFPSGTTCAKGLTPPQSDYTTYSYDLVNRLTNTVRGDGGQTTLTFNDTVSPLSVTTSSSIDASQNMVSTALFDGLGRVKQTRFNSDPQGIIYVDTTYDAVGRVSTVSNPYRSGADPTTSSGTTSYIYDALGRKCVEIPPDGTAVSGNTCPASAPAKDLFTQYSGNTSTVTDQTGKKRQSTTDGLGRLTRVVEDPGGLGYITNYSLDALGNLTQVVQNGSHTRTFTYDSLSRLLTSNNPEVGTITHNYDSDLNCPSPNSFAGLLVSKVDARGIHTCAQYDLDPA
jgi:YD repeat-containing protein